MNKGSDLILTQRRGSEEIFSKGLVDLPLAILSGCFSWANADDRNQDMCGRRKWKGELSHHFTCILFFFFYLAAPSFSTVCRLFSCGMQSLSCSMWDLVPWSGIEPGLPALGVWSLSHWVTREFQEVIRFRWGHESGAPSVGTVPLLHHGSLSGKWSHREKAPPVSQEETLTRKPDPADLFSWTSSLQNWWEINVCCSSHPVRGVLL